LKDDAEGGFLKFVGVSAIDENVFVANDPGTKVDKVDKVEK
jgi:hypothetical protein